MRRLIEEAKQKVFRFEQMLDERVNRLVRTRDRNPEALEVRDAILGAIEEQIVVDRLGRSVFPHARVTVELLAEKLRHTGSSGALSPGRLQAAARRTLAGSDCRVPPEFSLQLRPVAPKPADWPDGVLYRLFFDHAAQPPQPPRGAGGGVLTLTFSRDETPRTFHLVDGRLGVGSVDEVRDRNGRLVTRNAVCIGEADDPARTVSRRHAFIALSTDPFGRAGYVLHDEGSTYGTTVVRNGETIAVLPGTAGVRLRDGDEVCFGAARATVGFG